MEKLFTLADLRNAFIAGGEFERETIDFDMGEIDEVVAPDFGDWVKDSFGIEV